MELAPETLLAGRFAIEGPPLGSGASGVVYPARDRATGAAVAVKVLHPELMGDPNALERLQDEAAIAGRLRHPHVVDVIGLWSDGARWLLVSERVDAAPLDRVGPLPAASVVAIGLQLVDALTAAAAIGLVHGDVRPGNVLLATTGARLFDFGVGRLVTDRAPLRPGETAPERIDGAPASEASDVYGLGVVLHHALHGRPPFAGDSAWAVIGAQHARVDAIEGPRGLARLIRAMVDPDPVERPDLGTVAAALARLRHNPGRRLWMPRPIPSFRPSTPWLVYGADPRTGTPVTIRSGLSRREAWELVKRLRAEGWKVRGIREAFGVRDAAWIGAFTVLGGVIVPVIGALPALWLGVRWRAGSVRPRLRRTLPALSLALPPAPVAHPRWPALVGGLLLLACAAALAWWPVAAIVPLALLVALIAWSWKPSAPDAAEVARTGRVRSAFAELRALLDTRKIGLDDQLSLTGEAERLESDWTAGELEADRVLVRVDDLLARARAAPATAVRLGYPSADPLRTTGPARE